MCEVENTCRSVCLSQLPTTVIRCPKHHPLHAAKQNGLSKRVVVASHGVTSGTAQSGRESIEKGRPLSVS